MQDRKVWNADERELIALRARQLRRQTPTIGFVKLFEMSQDVLSPDRRRKWHNKAFDQWIVEASFTPSAAELAAALAEKFAQASTGGDSVLKALGVFLGVTGEGESGTPATEPPGDPADDPNQGSRKNNGRSKSSPSYRQARTRWQFMHLYESIASLTFKPHVTP